MSPHQRPHQGLGDQTKVIQIVHVSFTQGVKGAQYSNQG